MLRVCRVLEIFLEMNVRSRSLDQSLEKVIVVGVGVEPEMFEHIVSLIVTLVIPAAKVGAIKWVLGDLTRKIGSVTLEVANESGNSFAFGHEALNFTMPQMMGKPTFPEGPDKIRRRSQE